MENYFTEGSAYQNYSRIMEFALNYHILLMDSNRCLIMYNRTLDEVIDDLKNAFYGEAQSTKAAVIKALVLMSLFDDFSKNKLLEFIESLEPDSHFIDNTIRNARKICQVL